MQSYLTIPKSCIQPKHHHYSCQPFKAASHISQTSHHATIQTRPTTLPKKISPSSIQHNARNSPSNHKHAFSNTFNCTPNTNIIKVHPNDSTPNKLWSVNP
ncbi:hypothetical protein M758_2G019900 [Ceratodon purpureus]|uniref:Uncharacterized protein n=1 Tax=Ceratodon purpureus TaxID=3225 RepID=A0A8T0IRB3_CERPU|nr:hypothetical protein KC19_2G020700 [Ceratodon purpureus]KAG0625001.1 hypothetical protein M758_2G019900 [Ceratodon purpureus]